MSSEYNEIYKSVDADGEIVTVSTRSETFVIHQDIAVIVIIKPFLTVCCRMSLKIDIITTVCRHVT